MIRPFRVEVSQNQLDELSARLRRANWPSELPGDYGVSGERVRALQRYWLEKFDWRAVEDRLNAYPQFVAEIDGEEIHFLHVRSERPDATALVLTHGWPGSVLEFFELIPKLSDFHLVIPSLPGFGFSGPTRSPGWNRWRIARAWATLMAELGYERFGAVGNDAGALVSPEIGREFPERVIGVHVTQLFAFPSGDPSEFQNLSEADQAALAHLQWFYENKMSFNQLHSQQPQTLAFALADSPVGLLAWNGQLFDESLDDEFVVANVALYWLTGTSGSAMRLYYEDAHAGVTPSGPTTVPTGLAMFEGDFQSVRRFADREHANIVSWNAYSGPGGHYAAHQASDVLAADITRFFAETQS
ncbi:epoxide hydrolase [Cryptosporangium minutisporangium]|uniref:Epoxide hydrolase N-terminal domain-containing protein n=1 Tax=Cryptosporangium minutisporangium TaxID=113569 RepID=A0ABP6SXS2_9ACTN